MPGCKASLAPVAQYTPAKDYRQCKDDFLKAIFLRLPTTKVSSVYATGFQVGISVDKAKYVSKGLAQELVISKLLVQGDFCISE